MIVRVLRHFDAIISKLQPQAQDQRTMEDLMQYCSDSQGYLSVRSHVTRIRAVREASGLSRRYSLQEEVPATKSQAKDIIMENKYPRYGIPLEICPR